MQPSARANLEATVMAQLMSVEEVDLSKLSIDPLNVRHKSAPLGDLEDSIKRFGVLEPIIARKKGEKYLVIVGSRRFTAAKALGLKRIPTIVKELSDEEAFLESAVENIQRESLDPQDELDVVEKAFKLYGSLTSTAKVFGKSSKWVEDHLKVRGLLDQIKAIGGKSAKGGPREIQVPRDTYKAAQIARTADAVFTEPQKKADLFEALKDKPREQVERATRRLRSVAEEEPETLRKKSVSELVDNVLDPARLQISVEFSTKTSKALVKAARSRDVAEEDIIETAVDEWLRRNKFM